MLVSLYNDRVEANFDSRLHVYIEQGLIPRSSPDKGVDIKAPGDIGEPLFNEPFVGWYWEILSLPDREVLYKSPSLASESLKLPSDIGIEPSANGIRKAYVPGPEQQTLRIVEREISYTEKDSVRHYIYVLAGDADYIFSEVHGFRNMLVLAFAMLVGGLLIATFFQVRYGLRPLRDIGAKLAAIRSGQAAQLEGSLPVEIQPLQEELNALIQSNQQIIERARTHVGNLAHALKTPLSIITNEARAHSGEFGAKVAEQAKLMSDNITHHLGRAQIAARVSVVGGVTDVYETLLSLTNVLSRIYADRGVRFDLDCPKDAKFQGEKQDLQEMAGNLLDNACKWAVETISVQVAVQPGANISLGKTLIMLVTDDGPGLPPDKLETVVKRGNRLDESKPGSGLGLSIVADLSDIYYGSFNLEIGPEGGLCARLVLPAA